MVSIATDTNRESCTTHPTPSRPNSTSSPSTTMYKDSTLIVYWSGPCVSSTTWNIMVIVINTNRNSYIAHLDTIEA